jgi:Raf kinase inhibitor-like YbhB/YbcL family protein
MASNEPGRLVVSSPAFQDGEAIPAKYTCEGDNINPPLQVDHIPERAKTLALIIEDPDAPKGTFDHWLVWNIFPTAIIEENSNPGISGMNGAGKTGYHGPCPPSGSHRYYFHVYALDTLLDLPAGETKETLQTAMGPHILAKGQLMGRYQRSNKNKAILH